MPTDGLRPGMRLGKSIYTPDGRVLLQRGSELRENYIAILQRLRIPGIYVVNDAAPEIEPMDIVSEQSRQALIGAIREGLAEMARAAAAAAKPGPKPPVAYGFNKAKVKAGVEMIVSDLVGNRSVTVNLLEMRTEDDYTAGHSVQVCALSVLMGLSLGLTVPQLHELGLGAVLHDLGKATLPVEMLNRSEAGSPEELAVARAHTSAAWEVLSKQSDISFVSAAVSFQHHERFGGGGYPRGLHGSEIHQYARITAIADMFDTLTADRGSRKGYHPSRALPKMSEYVPAYLDPDLFRLLSELVPPYPVGTPVQLTGGLQGVVSGVERGKVSRPRVRILKESSGAAVQQPAEVDLSTRPDMEIARRLTPDGGFPFAPELMT